MSEVLNDLPFQPLTRETWRALLDKELKGNAYEEFLLWKSTEGFRIESYQDSMPAHTPTLVPLDRAWMIMEFVPEPDATTANKHALNALMNGAEAVWFAHPFSGQQAAMATAQVDANIAPVFITGNTFTDPFELLLQDGKSTSLHPADIPYLINGSRLRERGATIIEECALLLAQALEVSDACGPDQRILFQSGFGNLYLGEIAKLRAFRWLWASVLAQKEKTPSNPEVIAVNLTDTYAQNDEYTNILRATSSAMSAIIGGASFVMLTPWDISWKGSNDFSARISRNIQNLLREEARLGKNLNPADGAYFIEHLTVVIAEQAWKLVQHVESEGGFTEFAKSGKLRSMLNASRKRTLEAYGNNTRILLGVNKYQPADKKVEQYRGSTLYELLPDPMHLPFELQKTEA